MKLGEVCFLTNDVIRLADFYKQLLDIDNGNDDNIHQTLIAEETMLSIYNDLSVKPDNNRNICVAFTVEDMDKAYRKVLALGARVLEEPTVRPWGAINMSFLDPDNNMIFLRNFPADMGG